MAAGEEVAAPLPAWTLARRLLLGSPRAILTSPARWRPPQWVAFAAFTTAVVLAYREKDAIQSLVGGGADTGLALSVANAVGGGFGALGVGGALLLVGLAGSRKALETALVFATAGSWGFALTSLGQFVLAESRPRQGGAMHFFARGGHGISGHACAAALLFSPMVCVLGRDLGRASRAVLAVALLAWAAFIAFSRVRTDMHFAWNVLLGAGLGFFLSDVVVTEWRRITRSR